MGMDKYESFLEEIFKIDVVKEVFYQCMKINVNWSIKTLLFNEKSPFKTFNCLGGELYN